MDCSRLAAKVTAYVDIDEMRAWRDEQRYTRLKKNSEARGVGAIRQYFERRIL